MACWWAVQDEVLSGVHIEQLTALEQLSLQTALMLAQAGSERYAAVQHLHAVALPIGNRLHDEEVQAAEWRHRVLLVFDADWPSYGMGVACELAVVPACCRNTEQLATSVDINMMTAP